LNEIYVINEFICYLPLRPGNSAQCDCRSGPHHVCYLEIKVNMLRNSMRMPWEGPCVCVCFLVPPMTNDWLDLEGIYFLCLRINFC